MIAIGSDHAGFELKEQVMQHFDQLGIEYVDLGFHEWKKDDDYPVVAKKVARFVQSKQAEKGILICGTGIGMSICANKFHGIRSVVASDSFSVRMSRMHNDANVLCFGARVIGKGVALELVDLFLNTNFEGGRHADRVAMLEEDID